jgi:hypothetical protein
MVFYRYFKLYLLFQYLQNCSVILIATEISRACSSKTAKHLFDENFRRQLLMDGQYGNIVFFFIIFFSDAPSPCVRSVYKQ